MKVWEWECFSDYISACTVADCGPLHGPVEQFKITRDENLTLTLETVSNYGSSSRAKQIAPGTVQHATEEVRFEGRAGEVAIAQGVITHNFNQSWKAGATGVNTEKSRMHALEWTAAGDSKIAHTIQWLENMPTSFVWPHLVDRKNTDGSFVTFAGEGLKIELDDALESRGFGRCAAHLSLSNVELFVVQPSDVKVDGIRSAGCIIYQGSPSEDFQSRVKDVISFCMGQYLIDLGYTSFDEHWHPVNFKAKSGYSMRGAAFKLSSLPPTLLSREMRNGISKSELDFMANSLLNIYDEYDLQNVFWAYWHAIAAPTHIAAVHYGAAIESLQNQYARKNESKRLMTLIEPTKWELLSGQIEQLIDGVTDDSDGPAILKRKIKNLNLAPQSILMERFLSELGLEGGAVEMSAWSKRNKAAHGSKIQEGKFIEVIRDNKALLILLNRILLALSGASNCYFDYFSVNHPISPLASPIPKEK